MKTKKNKLKKSNIFSKHPIEIIEIVIVIIILIINIIIINLFAISSNNTLNTVPPITYVNIKGYEKLYNQISKKYIYSNTSLVPQINLKNVL
jgi:hypothetical protein